MYNDEKNLYHYTYRKDGSEQSGENLVNPQSVPGSDNEHRENVQEMKPVKKNRLGMKIAALCLCCALLHQHQRIQPARHGGGHQDRGRQDGNDRCGGLCRQCQ